VRILRDPSVRERIIQFLSAADSRGVAA